jgi:hypothetical protein
LALVVTGGASFAGVSLAAEPDPAELAATGKKTAGKMKKAPCSWTVTFTRDVPGQVIVGVLQAGARKRWTVTVSAGRDRSRLLRIVQRDGAWYVSQVGGAPARAKYRPFEAPLRLTTLYVYLLRAEPLFAGAGGGGLGKYEKTEKGVAVYRTPLPSAARRQLAAMVRQFEALAKKSPELLREPGAKEKLAEIKALVDKGAPTRVDLATGMLLQFGTQKLRTSVEDFAWRAAVAEKEFSIDGEWEDFTDDPTRGDLAQTVLVGYAGERTEPDNVLLDLKTGRRRRVPFRGAVSLSGCFLKGRKKVAVAGTNMLRGTIGIYEVDLSTGANRRLGGKLLAEGITLFPRLSPDGKTLAVYHKGAPEGLTDAQICLVDVATGEARRLGKALDCAHINWAADGKGLLMTVRKPAELLKPPESVIARMDLEGKVTELRKGARPLALPDGKRILFQDADGLWRTCDLEGKNPAQFGGGFKGATSPSLSPDGKRLVMIQTAEGGQARPVLVDLATGKSDKTNVPAGQWVYPSWR